MKERFAVKDAVWFRGAVHASAAMQAVQEAAREDAAHSAGAGQAEASVKPEKPQIVVRRKSSTKRAEPEKASASKPLKAASRKAAGKGGASRGTARTGRRAVRRMPPLEELDKS
jgi:hypothetical protein